MTLSKTEWQAEKQSRKNSEPANRTIKTMPQNNFARSWQLGDGMWGCGHFGGGAHPHADQHVGGHNEIRAFPHWRTPKEIAPHIDEGVETCDFVIDTKKPLIGTLTLLMLWQISPKDQWRGPFLALICVGCPRTQLEGQRGVDLRMGWSRTWMRTWTWSVGNRIPFRKWRCRNQRRRKSVPHYAA